MEGSLISDPLLGITPLNPNSDKRLNQTLRSRNKENDQSRTQQALDCSKTSPCKYYKKCIGAVWGICILILGCKRLLCSRRHNNQKFSITPNTRSISLDNYYIPKSCTAIPSNSL